VTLHRQTSIGRNAVRDGSEIPGIHATLGWDGTRRRQHLTPPE
jgi:hypothetical protein